MRRGRHFERKSEHPALRWMKNNPIKTVTGTLAVTAIGAGVVAVRNRTRVDSNSLGNGNEHQQENSNRLFTPKPTQPTPTKQSPAISLYTLQNEIVAELNFLGKVNAYVELLEVETVQDRHINDVWVIKDIEFAEKILVSIYEEHCVTDRGNEYFTQWIGRENTLDVSKPTLVSLRDGESFMQLSDRIKRLKLQHVGVVCARPYHGNTEDLLSRCDNLISAHFIMPYVTNVGDNWLSECDSLTHVTFAGMSSLARVGNRWMAWNPNLVSVDFKGLDLLKTVDGDWLNMCKSIIDIRFEGLHALVEVGNSWMQTARNCRMSTFEGWIRWRRSVGCGCPRHIN